MATCCCFGYVNEMDAGIIENCGRYERIVPAGCYCLMCPLENLVSKVSLRIQYLDVSCDTKTKDNVFVKVVVAGKSHLPTSPLFNRLTVFLSFSLFYARASPSNSSIQGDGRQSPQCLLQAY